MRTKLQRAATKARDAIAERNRLIVEARVAGATFREIAASVQLTPMGVRKITMKDED